MATPKNVQILKNDTFEWLNITKFNKKDAKYLRDRFNFDEIDLEDCLPPNERTKLVEREKYLFLILLYPVYNRATKIVEISELDLFIGQNFIVTNHEKKLEEIGRLFSTIKKSKPMQADYLANPPRLLRKIINDLLLHCFPMLVHISNDTDEVEKKIFTDLGKEIIYKILNIKTNIANFRKAIQSQKVVLERLICQIPKFQHLDVPPMDYFERLTTHAREIWNLVENCRDAINALHETNESLLSFRMNEIMKTLTMFSVIIFPLTLLAAIFGMNAVFMPLVDNPYGFWIIIGIMGLGMVAMLLFFKKRKWL